MGYTVLPTIDRTIYTDLSAEGLEGPFMFESGAVFYYDPREGRYYDRRTDQYLSDEDMLVHRSITYF